jgi:hypothetical protein
MKRAPLLLLLILCLPLVFSNALKLMAAPKAAPVRLVRQRFVPVGVRYAQEARAAAENQDRLSAAPLPVAAPPVFSLWSVTLLNTVRQPAQLHPLCLLMSLQP